MFDDLLALTDSADGLGALTALVVALGIACNRARLAYALARLHQHRLTRTGTSPRTPLTTASASTQAIAEIEAHLAAAAHADETFTAYLTAALSYAVTAGQLADQLITGLQRPTPNLGPEAASLAALNHPQRYLPAIQLPATWTSRAACPEATAAINTDLAAHHAHLLSIIDRIPALHAGTLTGTQRDPGQSRIPVDAALGLPDALADYASDCTTAIFITCQLRFPHAGSDKSSLG